MILVDTSVWIDHFRSGDALLSKLLTECQVYVHPFVIGELACGNLRNRLEILDLLQQLPTVSVASDDEVLFLIAKHRLMGQGIGYVDAHLLASSLLQATRLWTRDKRLAAQAKELDLDWQPAGASFLHDR